VPVYPTDTTIDEIFNEAPGNVRVQYSPGANNDFTFLSANVDAVTLDGGANVTEVIGRIDTFNTGNVYVDGLTPDNVYNFTIEVFYDNNYKTSNVKRYDVPVYPTDTTIDEIFNEAPGNVRVQYRPGANNDFTFLSANVTAVTEDSGGENRYTAIDNLDDFNLGNVYVDGLVEGNVYDFTIEVFYNIGLTTNIAIRADSGLYYLDDVSQDTVHLNVGDTLVFTLDDESMSGHPLWIETTQNTNGANYVSFDEVTNNGARSGEIRWTPTTVGRYYYNCEAHNYMGGEIVVSGNPTQTITSNVKEDHRVPVYPTDTTIDIIFTEIFNEAPGNVRVQYSPGANNDFTFLSANVDAVTYNGGANVTEVIGRIDTFNTGNVYVDGLSVDNVYDFVIEVIYKKDGTSYETSSNVKSHYVSSPPVFPTDTIIKEIFYEAPGNVRVQYSPGANNDFQFSSANVDAVTYNGGANVTEVIGSIDTFNTGNVYVDGLTPDNVYDFTIEVFYEKDSHVLNDPYIFHFTTANIYSNIEIRYYQFPDKTSIDDVFNEAPGNVRVQYSPGANNDYEFVSANVTTSSIDGVNKYTLLIDEYDVFDTGNVYVKDLVQGNAYNFMIDVFYNNKKVTYTYNVRYASLRYFLNDHEQPDIELNVGDTLMFVLESSVEDHPLWIKDAQTPGPGSGTTGVVNNGNDSGTITWTPTNVGTFYYICEIHPQMTGIITVRESPTIQISSTIYENYSVIIYPTDTTIDEVFNEAPGNVRVQYSPGANNDFQFSSANVDAVTYNGGANVTEVIGRIDTFNTGNVYVDGLTPDNEYNFTIEVFYVKDGDDFITSKVKEGHRVPVYPTDTTIDEIFNEAPGNLRVQYSPGANNDFTFLSANVTAVTLDGGVNGYTFINHSTDFNSGNVYVDGLTQGDKYDVTIDVLYSDNVRTSAVSIGHVGWFTLLNISLGMNSGYERFDTLGNAQSYADQNQLNVILQDKTESVYDVFTTSLKDESFAFFFSYGMNYNNSYTSAPQFFLEFSNPTISISDIGRGNVSVNVDTGVLSKIQQRYYNHITYPPHMLVSSILTVKDDSESIIRSETLTNTNYYWLSDEPNLIFSNITGLTMGDTYIFTVVQSYAPRVLQYSYEKYSDESYTVSEYPPEDGWYEYTNMYVYTSDISTGSTTRRWNGYPLTVESAKLAAEGEGSRMFYRTAANKWYAYEISSINSNAVWVINDSPDYEGLTTWLYLYDVRSSTVWTDNSV
jgi:plastocyanin